MRMHLAPTKTNSTLSELKPQNGSTGRRRANKSTTMQSIKSLIDTKRAQAPPGLVISQPKLAEGSREKLRKKVRHSPSMLSINAQGTELAAQYERRQIENLLKYSSNGAPQTGFTEKPGRRYRSFSLGHTPVGEVLQTLRIHGQLRGNEAFESVLDVHVLQSPSEAAEEKYTCAFEMPDSGCCLYDVTFASKEEPVHVLRTLIEALAYAEEHIQFEHRNLHPGNVMINRDASGVIDKISIVNCDLSRTQAPGAAPLFVPLEHPAFYEERTPVLSLMQKAVKNPADFEPVTNVLWLTYLARYMYNERPSSQLRSLHDLLNSKWPLKRRVRSAREASARIKASVRN